MFHLALEELDFGLGQVEQGEDAVVEFGFGVREFASLAVHLDAFLRRSDFSASFASLRCASLVKEHDRGAKYEEELRFGDIKCPCPLQVS
jgi:hypothetical protein